MLQIYNVLDCNINIYIYMERASTNILEPVDVDGSAGTLHFHAGRPLMLRVYLPSGEELAAIPVETLSDVRSLKGQLEPICGWPRFRLKLLHDGRTLDDTLPLNSPLDVQLIKLSSFTSSSEEQILHFQNAVKSGDASEVEKILMHSHDPNLKTSISSPSPLSIASKAGHADTVRLLLEARAHCSKAIRFWENLEVLRLLVPKGFHAFDSLQDSLYEAVGRDEIEAIHLLLEARAKPEHEIPQVRDPPLLEAISHRNVEALRVLLQHLSVRSEESYWERDDRMTCCCRGVVTASFHGNAEILRVLLDGHSWGPLGDDYYGLPVVEALHTAAKRGHRSIIEVFRQLLGGAISGFLDEALQSAAVSERDDDGWLPCWSYSLKSVEFLLEEGAHFTDSFPALIIMLEHDPRVEVARSLLELKAGVDVPVPFYKLPDVNERPITYRNWIFRKNKNVMGMTALMYASGCGHVKLVRMLLEARAAANYADSRGRTAFSLASQHGHAKVFRVLMLRKLSEVGAIHNDCSSSSESASSDSDTESEFDLFA